MQSPASHKALAIQHSDTKIVELSGYVVIVVQSLDGKIKLFGSPADKDNLEVADEVLNVNERVLGDLPHAEVVRYLHECVRSCVIKLRVKRRSDARLCFELANSVQDAFVIAVEEKARQRLQRLLAQQRVKPVDMSQLSLQLNQAAAGNSRFTSVPHQDFSFLREGSPIYVTSLSGQNVTACSTKTTDSSVAFKPAASQQQQYTNTRQQQQQQKLNNSNAAASKLPQLQLPANAPKSIGGPVTTATTPTSSAVNNHKPLAVAGAQLSTSSTGSVGSKTVNNNHIVHGIQAADTGSAGNGSGAHPQTSFDSFFGNSAKSAPASVGDQSASSGSTAGAHVNGHSAPREQLTTLSEVDSDPATDSALEAPTATAAKTSSVQVPISTGGSEVLLGDQSLRQDIRQRRRSGSSIVVLDGDDAKAQLPNDEGEFISGPLKYSPLQQQQLYAASISNMDVMSANNQQDNGPYQEMAVDVPDSFIARNKTPPRYPPPNQQQYQHHQQQQLNSSVRPVPPPRDHLRIEQDGRLVNRAPAPQVPERNHPQHGAGAAVPDANAANIEKYKEQLRRRHEDQARVAQEHEFLRASLRESRKLQALQNNHRPATIGVENTAYVDDDDVSATELPKASTPTFDDVQSAIVQLHYELNKSGLTGPANRIAMVQQLLASAEFENALALREQVLQRRRTRHHNPVSLGSQELAKECIDLLAESNSPHAIELGDILSSYEMEGLMFTHDAIANDTDSSIDPNPLRRRRPSDAATAKQPAPVPPPAVGHHQMAANMINNNGVAANAAAGDPSLLPKLPAVYHSGEISDPIRIIKIEKSTEPLGATIRNEGDAVIIGRIVRGGAAEKSGLLHENDEILEVNGFEMSGRNVNDVCGLIASLSGTLTFLIVPAAGSSAAAAAAAAAAAGSLPRTAGVLPVPVVATGREPAVLHVRAHFDYDPEDDRYIPCRELGISFQKGDVLHVISRDDSNWWQAYREGEEDQSLAGLIPSQSFQHQREAIRLAAAGEAGLTLGSRGGKSGVGMGAAGKGSTLLCMRKATKGRNKRAKTSSEVGYPLYATTTPDDPDPEEILTYEEVALYYPRESHKRPIVLIGPPNIGRHELRQRLIADSDRFAAAMPHTSRPRRENENDYHFITRVQFEADILSRKFVEHGEYERAYYGTSLEAIRTVVSSGKICVLNLHPQSLKLLRASDLKPYVVLVAPPSLEKLRQKKERNSEPVKDDDLKEIIATARDMEARWGHQFDMIIINNDTERAYHQLLAEINSLEREPQWVPASWVH